MFPLASPFHHPDGSRESTRTISFSKKGSSSADSDSLSQIALAYRIASMGFLPIALSSSLWLKLVLFVVAFVFSTSFDTFVLDEGEKK